MSAVEQLIEQWRQMAKNALAEGAIEGDYGHSARWHALLERIAALDAEQAQLHQENYDLKEAARTLSQQLERRANGADALTIQLRNELEAAEAERDELKLRVTMLERKITDITYWKTNK